MLTERDTPYQERFGPRFVKSYRRYKSLHRRIDQKMAQVLSDPYQDTERLGKQAGGPDLRGCRSVRVTRNFRIVFVIWAWFTGRVKIIRLAMDL